MSLGRSKLVEASPLVRYAIAAALVAAAAIMRIGMTALVSRPLSAPLFIIAIVFTTWIGGLRLGLFSSFASAIVFDYFFARPVIGDLTFYDHTMRSGLFFAEGALITWLIDRLRLASDEVAISQKEFRDLSEHQREERDSELKRISREIHDELGQVLTSLKLDLHLLRRTAEQTSETPAPLIAALDDASSKVDVTIGNVRRISSEMRPSILDDFGLVAALEWQTKEFSRKTRTDCEFTCVIEELPLNSDANTGLFRIAQEALTNIARHAHATWTRVSLLRGNGDLRLCIEDNGRGIEVASLRGTRSLGLLGMRERARLLGGEIDIRRGSEEGGTVVELVIPMDDEHLVNAEVEE